MGYLVDNSVRLIFQKKFEINFSLEFYGDELKSQYNSPDGIRKK